jgi:hypothetical protein
MAEMKSTPDTNVMAVKKETLVANTYMQITIPSSCRGMHVYPLTATAVCFAIDAVATMRSSVYIAEGFFAPQVDSARILAPGGIGSGHTLNLICADAGDVWVEFWS